MRASILLPLLVLWVRKLGGAGVVTAWIGGCICYFVHTSHGNDVQTGRTFAYSLLLTGYYLPYFLFGIFVAARSDVIGRQLACIPLMLHLLICAAALAAHIGLFYARLSEWGGGDPIYGIFAAYLIAVCVHCERPARMLTSRPLLWLGDISYSLYLLHWPLMMSAYYLLYGHVSRTIYTFVTLPLALAAAYCMHSAIERPSHRLGRRLTA